LLAVLCDRAAITMRNLSLAAMVILIYAPHEILSPGFQMSFAATAALIAIFDWWSRQQINRNALSKSGYMKRFIIYPVLSTLAASLVAGGASGLFAAYHFANTAPLGLVSNVASLPIMSIFVMPPALLAALLMPFGLEFLPLQIMGLGIEGIKLISFWVADLSPNINPGMVSNKVLAFLTLALVILLFLRSFLRLFALLPLLVGVILYFFTPLPLALIDEEGRLVAVATKSGRIALSVARPNNFILSNWRVIFNAEPEDFLLPDQDGEQNIEGFSCYDLTCQARLSDGQIFALALGKSGRESACHNGDLVLLNYVSDIEEACTNGTQSIHQSHLAKLGAAMIYAGKNEYKIIWAQGESIRPWNAHRYQSKSALGIP